MSEHGDIDDGFGNSWPLCSAICGLEVVRPGKVQCNCEDRGTGAIDNGDPQTVTLTGREYERYLEGALNHPPDFADRRTVLTMWFKGFLAGYDGHPKSADLLADDVIDILSGDTPMSDLDHYELLQITAERVSERVGVHVTVRPANYWSGGVQQGDFYDITLPWSHTGPMNFWFAYGWLEGFGAPRPLGDSGEES